MLFSDTQMLLMAWLSQEFVKKIKRDNTLRKNALRRYDSYAMEGERLTGAIEAINFVCGRFPFDEIDLQPFVNAVRLHLLGTAISRKPLSEDDKIALLKDAGFKCQECGETLSDFEVDHIIPFCTVFDTLGLENRRCLCKACNKLKGSTLDIGLIIEKRVRVPAH